MSKQTFNRMTADVFRECAELLRQQDANPFRINAYQRAAATLDALERDARDIVEEEGQEGLIKLPGIGKGLAASIVEIARAGRLSLLERLRGESRPEALFTTVPGLGPRLAHTIHETLHIDTLEELELAAHDGRLDQVPGLGARRIASVRASLASQLGRRRPRRRNRDDGPGVDLLLKVDQDYRKKARADSLPRIAPKRFNPEGKAWLPVMHSERGGWHFTALYSNTARAHELGRTHDWVVLYFYDEDHEEGQHTIVTETQGPLRGKRVVRGREGECADYYGRTRGRRRAHA